jgi:hypothetical protein
METFPCRTCSSSAPPLNLAHSNYSLIVPCHTWMMFMAAAMVAHLAILPPPPTLPPPRQRVMSLAYTGLLCRGKEFVVVEAKPLVRGRNHSRVYTDIFWLRSSDCKWNSVRARVLSRDHTDDFCWQTYTVVPVCNWLCWIDFYNGILFDDMFHEPTPTVTLVRLPPEEFPASTDHRIIGSCWMYRSVSAVDTDSRLKFVKVDCDDGIWYGPLRKRCWLHHHLSHPLGK